MKYWNKDKKKRKNWINVEATIPSHEVESVKRWCQLQPSNGKFCYKVIKPFIEYDWCVVKTNFVRANPVPSTDAQIWSFQFSEDAVLFSLRWS